MLAYTVIGLAIVDYYIRHRELLQKQILFLGEWKSPHCVIYNNVNGCILDATECICNTIPLIG